MEVEALSRLRGGIGEIADALCSICEVDVALQSQMGKGRHRIGPVWNTKNVSPKWLASTLTLASDFIKGGIPLAAGHLSTFPYWVEIVGNLRLLYLGEGFDVFGISFYSYVVE